MRVLREVLELIKPSEEEVEELKKKVEELGNKISKDIGAEFVLVGSLAKGTSLKGKADADLFFLFPEGTPKEEMEKKVIEAGKRHLERYELRYAEHPYVRGFYKGVQVDLVPAYRVEKGKKVSAVDRTPHHLRYFLSRADERVKDEVRLLKKFLQSLGLYGAEVAVQGFSGYLCELLILHYGSFLELLKNASKWRFGEVIDLEGHWKGKKRELRRRFRDQPLIVVDPTDPARNVASPLSRENFARFILACRLFLKDPKKEFFFLEQKKLKLSRKVIRKIIRDREAKLFVVRFPRPDIVLDTLYPQLRKAEKAIKRHLELLEFEVFKSFSRVTEQYCLIIFELSVWHLPNVSKRIGPPITNEYHSNRFIEEHEKTLKGPRVEGVRLVIELPREIRSAREAIKRMLRNPKDYGIPKHIAALCNRADIIEDEEVLEEEEEVIEALSHFYAKDRIFWAFD